MIKKGDVELVNLKLWRLHAGAKRPGHWKDHRSAKECRRVRQGPLGSFGIQFLKMGMKRGQSKR